MIEEIILKISITAGAIITIVSFVKIVKPFSRFKNGQQRFRKWVLQPIMDNTKEYDTKNVAQHSEIMCYVDELKKQISQIDEKVLKMAICSPYIPLEERVNYGNEYVEVRHKNGKVKAQHEINKKELYEQVEQANNR